METAAAVAWCASTAVLQSRRSRERDRTLHAEAASSCRRQTEAATGRWLLPVLSYTRPVELFILSRLLFNSNFMYLLISS
jgi:hypothetical protein